MHKGFCQACKQDDRPVVEIAIKDARYTVCVSCRQESSWDLVDAGFTILSQKDEWAIWSDTGKHLVNCLTEQAARTLIAGILRDRKGGKKTPRRKSTR
jgi:hypothetical protein